MRLIGSCVCHDTEIMEDKQMINKWKIEMAYRNDKQMMVYFYHDGILDASI